MKMAILLVAALFGAAQACAQEIPAGMRNAQIVYLGEVHDNPVHHERQAGFVSAVNPAALVFEMLTDDQAAQANTQSRSDRQALETALDWQNFGWPDFGKYHPLFAAVPQAKIYGAAVPREIARQAMKDGIAHWFGPEAATFGLTTNLPDTQQTEREALQMAAHCDALPQSMLPVMVDLQRLRDAVLARSALRALDETGGPVIVITGNGHARKDWGAPSYVAALRPEVSQYALGQSEDDETPDPAFDLILSAPAAEREDPCAAFR
ncbi:ChaN family lipoprotein [Thalassovita sp.]|uniref:ChaN family lipoprotein n=1 Tax=Thalassovita sp. TaxID=1979401 RepID=UPI0029DE5E77|nr:ChaN family lipoprotein [Thalassovita sp.]